MSDTSSTASTGESNNGSDVWVTLLIAFVVFVLLMILFEILVYVFPTVFYYRPYLKDHPWIKSWNFKPVDCPPRPSKWPMSWLITSYQTRLDTMLDTYGIDVCTVVGSLDELFFVFLYLSVFGMMVLAPTFATGPNKNLDPTNDLFTSGLSVITMSNLESRDPRLWVAWIYELLSPVLVMYVLFRGYERYVGWRRRYKALNIPNNYAIILCDIPPKFQSDKAIATFFNEIYPDCVAVARVASKATHLQALKDKYIHAVTNREYYERLSVDKGARIVRKGCCGRGEDRSADAAPDDMIAVWQDTEDKLLKEILERQAKRDPRDVRPTHSGFVIFHDKNHATVFGHIASWVRNTEWVVRPAPEVLAIDWMTTNDSQWSRRSEDITLVIFVLAVLVLYVPIVLFIQGLHNIENLVTTPAFSWLDFILTWPTLIINLIQGFLPPILLGLVNVMIPVFIRWHMRFKFGVDVGVKEAKCRDVYLVLLAFINFFYNLGIGATISSASLIASGSARVVDLIAIQIPIQSFFMMKFIINNALMSMPGLLLEYPRFCYRPFVAVVTGITTIRQQENLNTFFCRFNFFKFHGIGISMSLIGLAYATIAPIMCVFCALYYFMASACYKFGFLYNRYSDYTMGGILYPGYFTYICICLYVKQVFMAALFAVYLAPEITVCMAIPVLFTIQMHMFILRRFKAAGEKGALYETHFDGVPDVLPAEFLAESYVHPGLIPPKPLIDLSGASAEALEVVRSFPTGSTKAP